MEQKLTSKPLRTEPKAMALVERAVHLLRRGNWVALAEYYLGTLPFVLALLYFWSDMSSNPMAAWYCGPWAAGVALLFVWMKLWQVKFCRRLWCRLQNEAPEKWTWKRTVSTAVRQIVLHATWAILFSTVSIAVRQIALHDFWGILLPFAVGIYILSLCICAFYQNLCVLDDARYKSVLTLAKSAKQHSALWPLQNFIMLFVMQLFGLIVFLNIGVTLVLLPQLLKSILGIETIFTLSGLGLLNTTFLAVVTGLTYLCIDPIMKALYVLRCFYGRSRHTGDDLKSALRPFLNVGAMAVVALLLMLPSAMAWADAPSAAKASAPSVDDRGYANQLDDQIEAELSQRRFAWRLPREKVPKLPEEQGWIGTTLKWIGKKTKAFFRILNQWIEDFFEWLRKKIPSMESSESSSGGDHLSVVRWIVYALGFGLALWLIYWLIRWFKNSKPVKSGAIEKSPDPSAIDLNDENITAEDLPLDRWLAMAQEMMESKDFRRALRAMYLSILAQLADAQRVKIARYKSNRDYARELARREHAEPELVRVFDWCISIFERSWYGMHSVDRSCLDQFMDQQKRIATLVQCIA